MRAKGRTVRVTRERPLIRWVCVVCGCERPSEERAFLVHPPASGWADKLPRFVCELCCRALGGAPKAFEGHAGVTPF